MGRAKLTDTNYADQWPEYLRKAAQNSKIDSSSWQPVAVDMSEKSAPGKLRDLTKNHDIEEIHDNYDEQLAELFLSQNAQLYRANPVVQHNSIKDFLKQHYEAKEPWQMGSWIYYPWNRQLVHVLDEELFWELRTIRNHDLMTSSEQQLFAGLKVACAGMSVGSSAAVSLVLQGGSKKIKLSDSAVISGSNLNRVRTGVSSVGLEKSIIIARQLYEMNPYISVERLQQSVSKQSIAKFFDQPWPIDLVIDEIDDLEVKVLLRVEARRRKVPVLMATDLADDVMLDVERFDLDSSLPLFHGLVGKIEDALTKKMMTQREWLKYATSIIGTKNVPLRMQQSLLKVGSTLPTQPQLGGTAMMAGAVLAYAARKISLGEKIKSGRTSISLDKALSVEHQTFKHRRKHRRHTKMLQRALSSL